MFLNFMKKISSVKVPVVIKPTKAKSVPKKTRAKLITPPQKITKPVSVKKASVKKVAKKKVATKSSETKKTLVKSVNKKSLIQASDEKSFWVSDGQILNNLLALANSFEKMDKLIYQHHANSTQNDFADWVETVLCDDDCATALRKAKTPKTANRIVTEHLKFYII